MASAYSTTPLAKKLGIKAGYTVKPVNAPGYYFGLFMDVPDGIALLEDAGVKKNFIHFFTKEEQELYAVND
jgi:hypothetical protein